MRSFSRLLVVFLTVFAATAMASDFIPDTLYVVHCVDGQGLKVEITFNSRKGFNEAQIVHKVVASGFAQPRSIVLLKAATPVVLKASSGDQRLWVGQSFSLNISTTHLLPNGGHVSYLQAILDNGQRIGEQVSCR